MLDTDPDDHRLLAFLLGALMSNRAEALLDLDRFREARDSFEAASDAFTLAGVSRDIAAELSQSRIVALVSGSEGVPTALLEGMAAARPVVTTAAGHVGSIVDDGVEGFVVPIGDIAAIADRLSALLSNRTLAGVMGRRGRERAAHHSVERIAARLADVLASHGRVPC